LSERVVEQARPAHGRVGARQQLRLCIGDRQVSG
jgi:hypothetical protein